MEGGGNGRFDDIFQLRCLRSVAQILSETMGIGKRKGHSPFLLFGPRFVSAFGSEPRDALTIARGPLLLFVSAQLRLVIVRLLLMVISHGKQRGYLSISRARSSPWKSDYAPWSIGVENFLQLLRERYDKFIYSNYFQEFALIVIYISGKGVENLKDDIGD